jgi:hypothetical protein
MYRQKSSVAGWAECQKEVIWIDDIPWNVRDRILEPLSMPHTIENVNREKVHKALSDTNALLAYWTDDWGRAESEWWWICCDDKEYDIENVINSRGRRGIHKGMKDCSVSRVVPKDFPNLTYNIFSESMKSYGIKSSKIPTKEEYYESIMNKSEYEGFELWGTFVGDKLAAFATCVVIDDVVMFGSTKSDPKLHTHSPNNALFYHITKHYLRERGILYVTNGSRTLLHPTTINDFLIRMGFRKVFCRLNVELSNFTKLLLNLTGSELNKYLKFFWKMFPRQYEKFQAFLKLVEIGKTF